MTTSYGEDGAPSYAIHMCNLFAQLSASDLFASGDYGAGNHGLPDIALQAHGFEEVFEVFVNERPDD
ncbi:hypothetical protein EDB87DRAFT_1689299 [Lactarius vividus]|nr:hypothetical protein EDB87DRAFT_1689299 [Lactarius vividus]